jgi:hypothetical protein
MNTDFRDFSQRVRPVFPESGSPAGHVVAMNGAAGSSNSCKRAFIAAIIAV